MDVNDILVFTRVAQLGGFSKAAKKLKIPVSTVSRRVTELEKQLGVQLLVRTTRSLKITEIGKVYLAHGFAIASELEKAENFLSGMQNTPQGNLRITATTDFGNHFLGQMVSDFIKAHPKVTIEIVLTERVIDLVEEGFDLAIRMGELEDSALMAKRIGNFEMQICASPKFLKLHGEPRNPDDLKRFECIRFTADEDTSQIWPLRNHSATMSVEVKGKISVNNMALVRNFAIAGEGLALMPYFMIDEDVRTGRLKILMKDWTQNIGPVHVVYPAQRNILPKMRAFIDHLALACQQVKWKKTT